MLSPSFRNKSYFSSGKVEKNTDSIFVKSFKIFGITASIVNDVTKSTEIGLNITPCVYAPNGSTGTIYFDYNSPTPVITPTSRVKLVESFFGVLNVGATMTVSNANYNYNSSSLNGTYTFSYLFNSIAALIGVTVNNLDDESIKYYPEKFDANPTITLEDTVSVDLELNQIKITNILSRGENSFISNGVLENYVLEFKENKAKVISIITNVNTGYEELIIDSQGLSIDDFEFGTFDEVSTFNLYK